MLPSYYHEAQIFKLLAAPPSEFPRYQTYAVSIAGSESTVDTDIMPTSTMTRTSPPKPILHQRPLIPCPQPKPAVSSTSNPNSTALQQYTSPFILTPTQTLIVTPSSSSTPNTLRTPRSTPPQSRSPTSQPKSTSPTKSVRQKAFEKASSPSLLRSPR